MQKQDQQKARLNHNDQIDFLRDFDLLTTIPIQQQQLYQASDLQFGKSMMTQNTYVLNQQKCRYKIMDSIQQFKHFGPGIYLLFKLLKFLSIIMLVLSVFSVACIIILVSGQAPRDSFIKNQMKVGILKTTIYNLTANDFSSYVGVNFSAIVIFSIFMLYWSEKQRQYVIQCLQISPLSSYSTVVLKTLPQKYNQNQLRQYLQQNYGQISQIYTVRNFGEDILYFKQMNDIVQQYKQQLALTKIDKTRKSHKMANLFLQFRSGHIKLKQDIKQRQNYKSSFAFIHFRNIQDREKLLRDCNQINLFCCLKNKNSQKNQQNQQKQHTKYSVQQISYQQCQMEPCGINWQNLHLSTTKIIIKTMLMLLFVVIILTLSILLIFFLSAVQMSVTNCKFKDLTRDQVLKLNDKYALISYCINLSFSNFYHQSDICSQYNSEYIKITLMIFMVPLSIAFFKLILTEIMKALVTFRRYAYQIKKFQSQLTIIFVFYFLVAGILQLLIYLGSTQASIYQPLTPILQTIISDSFRPQKITLYSDFVPNWYITSSYNIFIIGAISFNLSGIGIIIYCKIRRKIFYHFSKKQQIQLRMNQWLKGYSLQIEYVYAALLTITYFMLLFGSCMPILYILGFFSYAIMFWAFKYVFIRFCARPYKYNHSINRRVKKMIIGGIIMHCIISPVFLRAPEIGQFQQNLSILQRIINLWYYPLFACILLSYLFFKKPLILSYQILKQYCKSKRTTSRKYSIGEQLPLPPPALHRKKYALPTIVRKKHSELSQQLQSYSMHENLKYKDILRALYTINGKQRARRSCVLNKQLLHLYQENINSYNSKQKQSQKYYYRTLVQVTRLVRRDLNNYRIRNGKGRNPYEKNKKKLLQIYQRSKKGQNRRYTLFNSNIKSAMGQQLGDQFMAATEDNIIQDQIIQNQNQQDFQLQINSNITKTKSQFLKSSNKQNLEQVVQAASQLQETMNNQGKKSILKENKQNESSNKLPKKIKKLAKFDIPNETQKKLNNSGI